MVSGWTGLGEGHSFVEGVITEHGLGYMCVWPGGGEVHMGLVTVSLRAVVKGYTCYMHGVHALVTL